MDAQKLSRFAIWGALAAVVYLMVVQWNIDYGSAQLPTNAKLTSPSSTITAGSEIIDAGLSSDVAVNSSTNINNEDIPDVIEEKALTVAEDKVASLDVVRITTDVLDLYIDLVGGDIVQVNLLEHKVDIDFPDIPLTLLQKDQTRLYIAQSGLVGKDGPDADKNGRPKYQVSNKHFILAEGQSDLSVPLVFKSENGTVITKTFKLNSKEYLVNIDYQIDNQSQKPWSGNLFAQIKRDNTIDPLADTSMFAMVPFLGIAYWSPEQNYNKIDLNDIREEPVKLTVAGGWASFVQHYFISAWVGSEEYQNTYSSRVNSKGQNIFGFTTNGIGVGSGESKTVNLKFYAGPKDQETLREISKGLELTVDYGFLWMIAQLLFSWLIFLQGFIVNWGWSIVALTLSVKLLFYPLNSYSFRSMANMRKLQPEMMRLKELYGDDRQKLSQATMEMYRKEKINPLGSCLPMLIQMPVFIALYWVLNEAVEIRHAPFILWIEDLSVMDPYFVLPILMGVSMFVQQQLSPMVFQDPMQEKIMKYMPVMFTFFFLWFPSGLVLYWLVNNILTIAQQWLINRSIENA